MNNDEIIAVVQAHKDGKEVQYRTDESTEWGKPYKITWNFDDYLYRVKPREWEMRVCDEDGNLCRCTSPCNVGENGSHVKVREVL